jgi:tetratricopeptide (TPR) repeat protein
MKHPLAHAVVIPFGVPAEARGLGLGLAALLHGFTSIDGRTVGLAQLQARKHDEAAGRPIAGEGPSAPAEVFVPPGAWRDLSERGGQFPDVSVVITGTFEPPADGRGMIHLLAFDSTDGSTRARAEAHVDCARAGETILAAFDDVWTKVGGELGAVRGIVDLGWEALESLLRAERCVLHDPLRNGPHDRVAAMVHLGRAVEEAPSSQFMAGRLAAVALESAAASQFDSAVVNVALRALDRATQDAPAHLDLAEATAALHVRLGNAREAEAQASAAIVRAPDRARLYVILSEARRMMGDLDGALAAVDAGLRRVRDDGLLATEHGVVLARRGDLLGAEADWKRVLSCDAVYPPAFVNLASLAAERNDLPLAQTLVDEVLTRPYAHPDVLRRAIQLAVATEVDGLARAARVARLADLLTARAPGDAWGWLVLARARVGLGEKDAALAAFARILHSAPETTFAAEAQREKLACENPQASLELDAVLRASEAAQPAELDVVAARGRTLALRHGVWAAEYARGVAERRRGQWARARAAFESALRLAPGATPVHAELVHVCLVLDAVPSALEHARRVVALEGRKGRALAGLALCLDAAGKHAEAMAAARAALAELPDDQQLRLIAEGGRREEPKAIGTPVWRRLWAAMSGQ